MSFQLKSSLWTWSFNVQWRRGASFSVIFKDREITSKITLPKRTIAKPPRSTTIDKYDVKNDAATRISASILRVLTRGFHKERQTTDS